MMQNIVNIMSKMYYYRQQKYWSYKDEVNINSAPYLVWGPGMTNLLNSSDSCSKESSRYTRVSFSTWGNTVQ